MTVFFQEVFLPNPQRKLQIADFWMGRVASNPEAFRGFMFSQIMRDPLLENRSSSQSRRLALEWYARTVETVNENMKDPDKACSDDNLVAVWNLAHHKVFTEEPLTVGNTPRPSQGPLNSLQHLHLYGGPIEPAGLHRLGWLRMLEVRGGVKGLDNMEMAYPVGM